MTATIMLAKGYDLSRVKFPAMVSEKLDGVPAKIHITVREGIYPPSPSISKRALTTVQTRSGKPYISIRAQVAALGEHLMDMGCMGTFVFVAEVMHKDPSMPFKEVSGLCRRYEPCDDLILNVFDFYRPKPGAPDMLPFGKRVLLARHLVRDMFWCKMVPQILVRDYIELADALSRMKQARGDFIPEGAIIRSCHDIWEEGKRGWGYQKVVHDPTTEVHIIGFEEAKSKDGEPLGMVGGLIGSYKGQTMGIGPGKLTHDERRELWLDWINPGRNFDEEWATVKYKRDPSYSKLRQPTFQNWRSDYEPDISCDDDGTDEG